MFIVKKKVFSECKVCLQAADHQNRIDAVVCLLILSRDPDYQKRLAEEGVLSLLVREAAIQEDRPSPALPVDASTVGALKCLSNVIFKNPDVIKYLRKRGCLEALVSRCEAQMEDDSTNLEVMLFDLKVLFLCSALDSLARLDLLITYFVCDVFVNLLRWTVDADFSARPQMPDVLVELLKLLFNMSYAKKEQEYDQDRYESTYQALTLVIRSLLVKSVEPHQQKMEIVNHSVNFLTMLPTGCYAGLLFQQDEEASSQPLEAHRDAQVTQALSVLLDFLTYQLDQDDKDPGRSGQLLTPILTLIATASRANRTIRKYFRIKILPHLGADVKRLPESGSTLRNRLCSRLTAKGKLDDGTVEAVAFLIFVLCREKIDRAVKYSGFGNFVGFLSRHGLMAGGGRRGVGSSPQGDYSSTSSDSETEAYKELKDQVNPVTGRVEPPRCNPMEGMSDEQKEYEVMQLVNKIDQLQRSGVIQPGVVGDDGRVRPAEHVLELVQNVPDDDHGDASDDSN
ncbi:unnamed protein product [Mesocestoides corti]|uniref:Synembryn-A n=1 Tax=Mesocestoides corti TaxID=53468 RepID=A0A0R3UK08_MESCO|nr:unnamed protein product [Mesocestoides corti]